MEPLRSSASDLPQRHHDVSQVFETSWQRLSSLEQTALKSLSVFHAGFSLDAAKTVTRLSLPLLLGLSNKSFLRRDDEGRFTQHPLVWQFLRKKAEQDERFIAFQEQHASYFTDFLQASEKGQEGLEVLPVQQEITAELANILAAWQWMAEQQREDLLAKALWSLCEYYRGTNHFQDGDRVFSIAAAQLDRESSIRARLLHRVGIFNNMLGDSEKSTAVLTESLAISQKNKATWDEAHALFVWGVNRDFSSTERNDERAAIYHKSAMLFKQHNDHYHEARALDNYASNIDDLSEKETITRNCIKTFRKEQSYYGLTLSLNRLAGTIVHTKADFNEAALLLEEDIAIERKRGNRFRLILMLNHYGGVLSDQGQYRKAAHYLQEALGLSTDSEARGMISSEAQLYGLGRLAFFKHSYVEAETYLQKAYAISKKRESPLDITRCLNALCKLALAQKQYDKAAKLLAETPLYLQKAKGKPIGRTIVAISYYDNLASLALVQKRLKDAKDQLQSALDLSRRYSIVILQQELLLTYVELCKQEGDTEQALSILTFLINYSGSTLATQEIAQKELEVFSETHRQQALERNTTITIEQVVKDLARST